MINLRFNGATLLETVLAMAMIAGVISSAMVLHGRIMARDRSADRLQAWYQTELTIQRLEQGASIVDPGPFEVKIQEEMLSGNVKAIHISCSLNEKVVLERSHTLSMP